MINSSLAVRGKELPQPQPGADLKDAKNRISHTATTGNLLCRLLHVSL